MHTPRALRLNSGPCARLQRLPGSAKHRVRSLCPPSGQGCVRVDIGRTLLMISVLCRYIYEASHEGRHLRDLRSPLPVPVSTSSNSC